MTIYKLDSVINFGNAHRGETISQILKKDPEWLGWAEDNIEWFELDDEAEAALDEAIYGAIDWD